MDALPTGDLAYLVYLLVFAAAAAGCLAGAWRARRQVSLPGVRRGLVGLLSASGLWALCHVGVLLSPGLGLKVALYETGLVVGFGTVFAWLWLCSAYSGRALHRRPGVRWAALILFLAVTLAKLTNRWHGLYFSAEQASGPFPHLVVDHHVIYWLTAGLSYALAAVGFSMLAEPLRRAQVGGGKLAGLFGLTALPLGANAIGYATPYLLGLSHEPVGVAAFALGAFALKRGQLEEASRTGREERPSLVLSAGGRVQNYNQAAAELLPALREGTPQEETPKEGRPQEEEIVGRHLKEALPRLGRALNGESPGTEPSGTEPSGTEPSGAELSGKNPSGKNPSGKNPSGKNPSGKNPSGKEPEESRELEDNEELRENGRRSEEKFSAEKPSAEEKLLEVPAGGGEAHYYRPVESQAGRGAGRLVVLQDVTEQVLRRRERASRLEALFNQSPDMINVHDAEGRVLEANPRFFEKTGHEEEDLQGMKVWDLDRSISREEALELWAGMEPGDRRRLEGTYRRKDGSAFPVEVDIRRLRLEGKGQFMAISRDITDRKVAERKLRRERDRLETLFESLPSPIVRCRAEGGRATVEEANPAFAETFPVGQEEAESQDLNDLLVPAGQKDAAAEIDRRAVEEGPVEHQVRRVAAGGEVRDFQLQVAGRQPEEGPPEIYAIYTDITDRKRRERRLQRAEALFQNAQDALFIVDVESGEASDGGASGSRDGAARKRGELPGEGGLSFSVRRVNPAFEEKTGLRDEDLRGQDPKEVFGAEVGAEIEEKYRECIRREEPMEYGEEVPIGGETTYWTTRIAPVVASGETQMIIGTARNVTEDRRREETLRRQKSLLERTQKLAGAWEADLQAGEVNWSDRIYEIHEMEPGAEIDLEKGLSFYAPESRERLLEATETLVEEGRPYDLELQIETAEGNRRWIRVAGAPAESSGGPAEGEITPAEGEITKVAGALQDITERKEEKRRRKQAISRVTDGIIEVGSDWRIALVNEQAEDIYGIDEKEVVGQSLWGVFGGLEGTRFEEVYREVMRSRHPAEIEEQHSEFGEWIQEQVYPNENGGLAFYFRVITERKEREEALREAKEEAERAKEEAEEARQEAETSRREAEEAKEEAEEASRLKSALLANMSHEIRTPLTSIIGFAEMLGREAAGLELPEESPLPGYASTIERSGKRLLETLNGVLNLSKLQAGQMEMESGPTCLPEQARLAAGELRPEAEEKEISLELETGGGPAALAEADEGGVQIVLRNLLSNAIKYTDEGGVTVRTYREDGDQEDGDQKDRDQEDGNPQEDGRAVLEVEDTGIGMDPEVAEGLFEPFRQASEGLSREYEGTGIGLAVTREAVAQMGGSVEVDTQKGQGTCMTVRLPLAGETEAA